MKLLVDTHALFWLLTDDSSLSSTAKHAYLDTRNKLFVSAVSFWELAIKSSVGKISLKKGWCLAFKAQLEENAVLWLAVTPEHCHQVEQLQFIHRDPFDRMLVAQAKVERMALLTTDARLKEYGVECLW